MDNLGAWGIARSTIGTDNHTQFLIMPVTCNFFSCRPFGAGPSSGALFAGGAAMSQWDCGGGAERRTIAPPVSGRSQILGREIQFNRRPFTVVGVTAQRFLRSVAWSRSFRVPYTMKPAAGRPGSLPRRIHTLAYLGRTLKPGRRVPAREQNSP